MRRVLSGLTAAAVMVAMLMAFPVPAMAQQCNSGTADQQVQCMNQFLASQGELAHCPDGTYDLNCAGQGPYTDTVVGDFGQTAGSIGNIAGTNYCGMYPNAWGCGGTLGTETPYAPLDIGGTVQGFVNAYCRDFPNASGC